VLDELPVPTYLTDAHGAVTYWNRACVEFAGREPKLGRDKWCVTWELYTTTGERLLHEDCPMAEAIKEKKEIRGKIAIALRPDGTRRAFTPYPAPLFAADGTLSGAVNLLIDVTDEQAGALAEQASRCRRLARATHDAQASEILSRMAKGYAATAASLKAE
jgi:PAS domain-containing protein